MAAPKPKLFDAAKNDASAPRPVNDNVVPDLSIDAFVRSVSVNADVGHMLLLGAGASVTSGMPTGATCVWMWKREIFLSNNPGLEEEFGELSLASVRQRIQDWLDRRGSYPAAGTPEEYGFYADACYPAADDRRAFFSRLVKAARPSMGYRLIPHLAIRSTLSSVWTTNFDSLTAQAAAGSAVTALEIGIDSVSRTVRQERRGELPCYALHGDYRYDKLSNTDAETQALEATLRSALVDRTKSAPLIVLGYSGRDHSIMEALRAAYSQSGAGALYWCSFDDNDPSPEVTQLLLTARRSGRNVFYVRGVGFDDAMRRLALACVAGGARDEISTLIESLGTRATPRAQFSVGLGPIAAILKSTSFKLTCPVEVYSFALADMPATGAWAWVREKIAAHPDLAVVPFKRRLWALGNLSGIYAAFGSAFSETPKRVPLDASEVQYEDGAITHLLTTAFAASMAKSRGLNAEGRMLWDSSAAQQRRVRTEMFKAHEGVLLFLRRVRNDTLLVLKPTLKVLRADGTAASKEDEKQVKIDVFGYQHNDKFSIAVEAWRRRLFADGTTFTCPAGDDTGFVFTVNRVPLVAAINGARGEPGLPKELIPTFDQRGAKILEPTLLFASKASTGQPTDIHPIRGLLANRPYDHSLTRSGLAAEIRLGVVCPQRESAAVASSLRVLDQAATPAQTEADYLLDFPGFASAFGLPLVVPQPGDHGWRYPAEPSEELVSARGARVAANAIIAAIEEFRDGQRPNVVLIVTPKRWENWRSYETETERFDLRDFVKAYCARRGIATQFLDEDTLSHQQACRVRWWLSLALYAKSFRTPWVLQGISRDTAFVGFGTSIDRHGPEGQKVVLGCSHIFNERGQGLQFTLSKIENPVFDARRRNVFLSRDDARRVGENIRQLFFEARGALPRRVVIHKQTPFRREEREGLLEGLEGVVSVEMLEIIASDAFRYLNSRLKDGKIALDGFPVARGTVIPIAEYEALLWLHGSAPAVKSGWKYYQGKRRIPSPLILRRHAGESDLRILAEEILGLSKMNWNTFDLYTQRPATIETSGHIARIGRLIDGYGAASYDYRLLM